MSAVVVASYGAGTDSTGMLCGMVERGEPPPHAILFSDTGQGDNRPGEKPHTYAYVRTFSEWLVRNGYPAVETIRKGGTDVTLEEDCLRRKALPSIAYGWKTCSQRFKVEPFEKWVNNDPQCRTAIGRDEKIVKLIGFDADEPERAKEASDPKFLNRFPLIEWGWGRDDCIAAIKRSGLPLPGKSACFFCPNSKPAEIRELAKTYPHLAHRALEMEANADLTTIKGLGRHFSWADVLNQGEMFPEIYSIPQKPCECVDG